MNLAAVVEVFKRKLGLEYITLEIVGSHSSTDPAFVNEIVKTCYNRLAPMVSA